MADYWSDKTVFAHVGGLQVASVTYEVMADFSKALPQAFSFTVTLRALGIDLGSTTVSPIANGPISLSVAQPIGAKIDGKIDNWGATDSSGNPIPAGDTTWKNASLASFLVTALGNVDLPVSTLIGLVPGLGWALKAAIGLLGSKVTVNIGHKLISLPIHRDASGNPIAP